LAISGQEVEGHNAVVRCDSGSILGVVAIAIGRFKTATNSNGSPFLDSKECAFETCGALKGGALVWVLAKINREMRKSARATAIRKYLLLSSHDGSAATSVGFCPIRVVCWNTLSAGLNHSASRY
jgi:hypothetical protein